MEEDSFYAKIQEPAEVAEAGAAMRDPNCGYKVIRLYDFSLSSLAPVPTPCH